MEYKLCKVIAEVGANHQGDFDKALEIIKFAALSGADFVKFQKRDVSNPPKAWNRPYDSSNSFGKTYVEHRRFLEF